MPRRGENIYKRRDGRWEGRIRKADGKYKYVYAKSYKELKEKKKAYQEYAEQYDDQNPGLADDVTSLLESWLSDDVISRVRPSTYEDYYNCMHGYVIPFFNEKNEPITIASADAFVNSIKNNDALSESYKRKIISIFKAALRKTMKRSADYALLMETIKVPKVKSNEIDVFSIKEQRTIENTVLHYADRRALGILLCFYTGIRLGELCALKWGDFDFDARTMSIARTVSRTKNFQEGKNKTMLLIGLPKSSKSIRKIPLPDFFIRIYDRHRVQVNENHFILTGKETPMDPRTYQKLYKKLLLRAGVKDRKFHAIRHTFATRALELGVDIKTLSEILGHSNVSITLNIYAHSLMEQKKIAIDKFNQMHVQFMKSSSFAVKSSVM